MNELKRLEKYKRVERSGGERRMTFSLHGDYQPVQSYPILLERERKEKDKERIRDIKREKK